MIGTLIGAGVGLFSSIFGGVKSAQASRKAERELKQQRQANEDWYRKRYNEDYTQTAEAQRLLSQARTMAQDQLRDAAGRQAVMGGTETVNDARESAAKAVSETLSDLAVLGSQRKDAVENQYMNRSQQLSQQFQQMYNQRAANAAAAASQGMQAGMGLVGADLSSHLKGGKGLFESLYKNRRAGDE
jgi:hypothetical protein